MSRLTSLCDHPGYKYLMQIAEQQIHNRTNGILLKPLASLDETLQQEYAKGEISGIMLFKDLTQIRIRDLREQIDDLLNTEENEDEVQSDGT